MKKYKKQDLILAADYYRQVRSLWSVGGWYSSQAAFRRSIFRTFRWMIDDGCLKDFNIKDWFRSH